VSRLDARRNPCCEILNLASWTGRAATKEGILRKAFDKMDRQGNSQEMKGPFPKSVSPQKRFQNLRSSITADDTLAIVITADPDSIASALALRRICWRRAKRTHIVQRNVIDRPDNLALLDTLRIKMTELDSLDREEITKWAVVDSQPHHNSDLGEIPFDIIIDHHQPDPDISGAHIDIREEYGATSTIMTEYLRAGKIVPSSRLATALFLGIKNDTNDFVRPAISDDLNAFRYLYDYANLNVVKKIESSVMTVKMLQDLRAAIDNLWRRKQVAHVHMGEVRNPDSLVIIADFLLNLAEVSWSLVSGSYGDDLVIILRTVSLRRDAGKIAGKLFGEWGSAGGRKSAARAEIPLSTVRELHPRSVEPEKHFVLSRIRKEWA
jgi:nanoRNase/pAp phosphatase (c-di-AMP/oligoRNAs hydrolase)